jgi:hypothetical protein
MRCDNCRVEDTPAFTLAAHSARGDDAVVVDFCSIECLQAWTAEEEGGLGPWSWGPDESGQPSRAD